MDPITLIIIIAFLSGIILGLLMGVKMSHSGHSRSDSMYRTNPRQDFTYK